MCPICHMCGVMWYVSHVMCYIIYCRWCGCWRSWPPCCTWPTCWPARWSTSYTRWPTTSPLRWDDLLRTPDGLLHHLWGEMIIFVHQMAYYITFEVRWSTSYTRWPTTSPLRWDDPLGTPDGLLYHLWGEMIHFVTRWPTTSPLRLVQNLVGSKLISVNRGPEETWNLQYCRKK